MKIKQYITTIIIIVGLLGGTATGLWLARSGKLSSTSNTEPIRNLAKAAKGASLPQTKGADNAVVTIEEFADFQCPPCAQLHPEIKKLEKDYAGKLRVIFR